jgi:protein phosphatase
MAALVDSDTGRAVRGELAASAEELQRLWQQPAAPTAPASVRRCLRCHGANRAEGNFCRRCGAPLAADAFPCLSWTGARLSDVGRVRPNNEDMIRLWTGSTDALWAVLVADGMGGATAGEVASDVTAAAIDDYLRRLVFQAGFTALRTEVALPQALADAVQLANKRVYHRAVRMGIAGNMGTTATLLLGDCSDVYVAHVGDSRAYLLTASGLVFPMTRDHSLVASLQAIGQLTAEAARVHPQRNLLYRCLGYEQEVTVDTFHYRLLPGDTVLVCSDGLTAYVTEAELAATVTSYAPGAAVQQLVQLANARGGEDNISVAVVRAAIPV